MRVSVNEFKSFLEVVKDSVREQAENVRDVTYDFQFKISLDPVTTISSSETLSRLDALLSAVSKFSESEFITWELAIPVTNRYTKDLQEAIQRKMEAKEAIIANPSKLLLPGQGK